MTNSIEIFGREIRFYGIIIAIGFLVGVLVAGYFVKKKKMPKDLHLDLLLIIFPFAIVGARLYYVIFDPSDTVWTFSKIIAVWNGGLAIYGGIIGGAIALLIYSKIKKVKVIDLLDLVAPSLIIGQVIGRWGNFFNQEAFGNVVANEFFQRFPFAVFIEADGLWHQATFFYESFWNLIGFVILFVVFSKTNRKGIVASLYLMYYGLGRAIIEGLRTDSLYIANTGLRVSQVLSIVLVIIGAITFVVYNEKYKKETEKEVLRKIKEKS